MKPFVSHDGQGAEVRVQISTGIVKAIDLNEDTGNAQVTFNVEGLKFPPKAWTNKREAAYAILESAKDTADPIDFRIESQRKSHVAIDVPIEELLANEPGKNVRSILAGVRHNTPEWSLTTEAVTDPEVDPQKAGGRVSAIGKTPHVKPGEVSGTYGAEHVLEKLKAAADSESLTDTVVATLAAQALLAGASIDQVHETVAGKDRRVREQPPGRASVAAEGPAWKDWNGDGRPNLGRLDVLAVAGVEKFVRPNFKNPQAFNENTVNFNEDKILYYSRVLLAVADRVQTNAYGNGFKADRGASSHSTIRGIIYDTVEHYVPFPHTGEDDAAWIKRLGTLVHNRFNLIINTASESYELDQIPSGTAPVEKTDETSAVPTQAETSAPVANRQSPEVTDPDPADDTPAAEPVATLTETAIPVPENELVDDDVPEPDYDIADDEVDADSAGPAEDLVRYTPEEPIDDSMLDENDNLDPEIAPSQATQEEFKALAKDAELDRDGLRKLVTLLEQTFGPKFGRIARIPDDALGEFVDFYAATGAENFRKVVESMP